MLHSSIIRSELRTKTIFSMGYCPALASLRRHAHVSIKSSCDNFLFRHCRRWIRRPVPPVVPLLSPLRPCTVRPAQDIGRPLYRLRLIALWGLRIRDGGVDRQLLLHPNYFVSIRSMPLMTRTPISSRASRYSFRFAGFSLAASRRISFAIIASGSGFALCSP